MSTIRKQSIISSVVIYIGFAIGLLNTYFFTRESGSFKEAEYGLISIFMAVAGMMMAFANLAMPVYIYKFFHYYSDNLPPSKNDMITWSLLVGTAGFILVMLAGWFFKHLVIRKFGENSPQLVDYYYWIFPLGFGLTIYSILEAYTINFRKSVLTNFLKEVQWRLFTTVLIVLLATNIIKDFGQFIKFYSFTYLAIAVMLLGYLVFTKKIYFTFKVSKVTRRYSKKILALCAFAYSGTLIFAVSRVFDTIVIASVLPGGIDKAGIFGIATLMTSVIQAPQRSIISVSIPHLSRAWKEKNMVLLQRVYQRSSINLLIFSCGIFILIALNYTEAIRTFGLKPAYLTGYSAFLLLGLTTVIELGTGLNAQIIITSNYWRFELISGVILLFLMLPLTYIFTKQYDIFGPAIASLISITVYNTIRIIFLWKKFRLFPFTVQSAYTILLSAGSFILCYYLFLNVNGFMGLVLRSVAFVLLYATGVIYFRLSPDLKPVLQTISKRLKTRKD